VRVLLRANELARDLPDRRLFGGVTLEVHPGDRVGVVGPNGAGKTTLLRILAGDEAPDAGEVLVPRRVRVERLRQELDPRLERPVREEVAAALSHLDDLEREREALEARIVALGRAGQEPTAELAGRYDAVRAGFEAARGFEREVRVERVLAGLGFPPEASARPVRSFSGGWLMRVELAKLLLSEPDVLLLDEPTNHLDLPAIEWLEGFLDAYRGAVVAVSHDRTFLRRHVTRIAALEAGRLTLYEGNYDAYRQQREERLALLGAQARNQERRRAELERFVERFRYKASKARQAQSRVKMLERLDRDAVEVPRERARAIRLRIPPPARAGEVVAALEGVAQSYGSTRVYEALDLEIRRGDRVALVGPNGAGKSTLLRIVAGRLPIERGSRRLGHNVRAVLYAQHHLEALDPELTVLGELERDARTEDIPRLRAHLGAFLFSGDDVEKRVGVLSGGEKARLALARLLLRPANFLILDEPTNHLDLAACEVLESALRTFAGTLLFVSHDRTFVNAVATRVIEVRAGRLREFAGNYDAYLARVGEAEPGEPEEAAAPARGGSTREARRQARERERARDRAARRLERIEAAILERESALEALTWRMADPEVHRDGERMRTLDAERATLRAEIDGLYGDWEARAAELEGDGDPEAEASGGI
jgi:ATP-binding cassette subfamily F protein 3